MVRIHIEGCHETTTIKECDWGMPFSLEELEIIGKLADLSKVKSDSQCQPIITIEEDN